MSSTEDPRPSRGRCHRAAICLVVVIATLPAPALHAQVAVTCPTGFPLVVESVLLGEAVDDNFGMGLDRAGDFNGDGRGDLVVGAPFVDNGVTNGGAAYLYLGDSSPPTNFAFRLAAEAMDDQMGYAVAGVGDINKDGYDDVAAGARFNDRAGPDEGAVWIVYGGPPPFGTNLQVITGNTFGPAGFGHAVAGADFNGDGYADVAVGAPFDGFGPFAQRGLAQIFFGGSTIDTNAPLSMSGEASGDQFGWSVDGAGDVNNDGYDDLVVGARWFGTFPDTAKGRAYLYLGGDPMDAIADLTVTGELADDWLGYSVAGVGNFNGDAFDDIAVAAPFFRAGNATGRVYVLFGGDPMDNAPDVILDGAAGNDQFGWSVDGGVDVSGDSLADIIVGARFNDCAANSGGAATVYFGGAPPDAVADIAVAGGGADDALGAAVTLVGPWAGMGLAGAAAAVWNDLGGSAAGAVSLFGLPSFRIAAIQALAATAIQITVSSKSGSVYGIEFNDAIASNGTYTPFAANGAATATGPATVFHDDFTTNSSGFPPGPGNRIYKVFRE